MGGLILKGYDDFEHNRKEFHNSHIRVEVPAGFKNAGDTEVVEAEGIGGTERGRATIWDKFKKNLIEMFKEEEDYKL